MLEEIITQISQIYQPNFRFIKTITPGFPKTTGTYEIPPTQYLNRESTGLTGTSSMILMSQAAIISLAHNVHTKSIPGLEDLSLPTLPEILQFCNNTVVCRYNSVNFKKLIWKKDTDKHFEFTITKINASKSRNKIFIYIDYVIGDQKITGSWTVAYVSDKFQR